ncbi:MAG: hypothetical protein HGA19_20405 [Oscillochloris sp.]|nr:hypothetical protein [Oscillochloris sp.]
MITFFTPATTAGMLAFSASLGLSGTLLLITMLIKRVLFEGVDDPRAKRLVEAASVVIAPLIFMFIIIIIFKIHELLI